MYAQQGYYPVQSAPPSVTMMYSPYPQRDSNAYSQDGTYSCHAPPSYHHSYTPTSSKSGRSHHSSDNMVKYQQDSEKISLPVHL
ncbi:hypothetical protein LSH36_534g01064 [Paralvinella palmiformis]|uniref:Uncharacterized protein n=1 Tax=Paralvinella palmiformis TaxID=53620 RepID=A0AAD9J8V5_9ANNE|nr:hypothetical protein LSH36_534g01064 [Paralvinella palmiformis]